MGPHPILPGDPAPPAGGTRGETRLYDGPVPGPSTPEERPTGIASAFRLVTLGPDDAGLAILAVECPNHSAPVPVDQCLDCDAFRHLGATLGTAAHVVCTPQTEKGRRA